ncbi:proteoglycan 4-like isoform X25 [Vespa mandarinia]|uniref:proteoglycan 4-like isoform X25 n=1 Tax=Vespa mandarinia TaxID=7446 RepID=UPI00161B6170|nr:proteoglycan 4-like isoform X25 [Vespa mandarinia]
MSKSGTNVPIMTRSKKEETLNDPKLLLNEVKNEATSKASIEKEKVDVPVVKQQVQSTKEVIKTDVQVEKRTLEQSVEKKVEKKFVIEKPTDKDRSSSKNDESLILEKNKPKDPPALKKDESLIVEKNKPKEEKRSALKKDECSILEKNKPKEVRPSSRKDEYVNFAKNKPKDEVCPFLKKDEIVKPEENKPKDEVCPFLKKDEIVKPEKNKPKDEVCSFLKKDEIVKPEKNKPKDEVCPILKKDEIVIPEKNKPKEDVRSSSKKDEFVTLEKNKPKEEIRFSPKKDESLLHEKNKPKEENPSALKKDDSLILEKNVPKEEVRSFPKKDEYFFLETNKPKEEDRSSSKKDESLIHQKNIPKGELQTSLKKDESLSHEKNKPKEEVRSSPKKDEFVIVEKNKSKEDDRFSPKKEELFIVEKNKSFKPSNVAVPRIRQPYMPPITNESPIVLSTHLVPSLPISLFELLAEVIEVATERPVNILYEPRSNRKVPKNITDIAILSANEEWEDGELLPVSFIFKHRLNKDNSPLVYADVIIASDLTPQVEDIIDMRGHRCALPDRSKKVGATTLLYNYLHSVGEGPAFFGNTLDVDSQIAVLQMVAGKQAEVGVLEAPVIMCQKDTLPGIESLRVVTSLGPLPPYRIMVNKNISDNLVRKLTSSLLNCNEDTERLEKLASYGILGFAINSTDYYEFSDVKSAIKRGPYY